MNTEAMDDAVQSMRDQGIRDACEGTPALYWFDGGELLCQDEPDGDLRVVDFDDDEYRLAFAYARAYCAERGE